MKLEQVDIICKFQNDLINSLPDAERESWYEHCLTQEETGDVIDGVIELLHYLNKQETDTRLTQKEDL